MKLFTLTESLHRELAHFFEEGDEATCSSTRQKGRGLRRISHRHRSGYDAAFGLEVLGAYSTVLP